GSKSHANTLLRQIRGIIRQKRWPGMIPDGIEKHHLALAVAEIDKDGVPWSRKSVHYDYVHSQKYYPPKYVISIAAKYAFGKELPSEAFNAVRARDYLRARGHT